MKIPDKESEPLDRLFRWVREETGKTFHGVIYLEIDIHQGKIVGASKGSKKSEKFMGGQR